MMLFLHTLKSRIRALANGSRFGKRLYEVANHIRVRLSQIIPDETYARMKYFENCGERLNLESPVHFNEKLWWLKLNNRDPLLVKCSDKVTVRDYVRDCGLEDILIPTLGVYNSPAEIPFESFEVDCYVKCNHVSGINYFYQAGQSVPPVFYQKFNRALKSNYFLQSREWNYKDIVPRIIVEESLERPEGGLIDYRFLCFHGEMKVLFVDIETAASDGSHNPGARRNVYDENFDLLDVEVGRGRFPSELVKKPQRFDEMVEFAEKLAAPFVFCRVDLYSINDNIYFGEITFYPGGCSQKVAPEEFSKKLGSWIDLSHISRTEA